MQTVLQNALLVGLLLVAAVHTRSRLAGAFSASAWCVGALAFGALAFHSRPSMTFLGITIPPWIYYVFMAALLTFNVAVIVRAFRRRTSASKAAASKATVPRGTGPTPGAS